MKLFSIFFLLVLSAATAQAATFAVNSTFDTADTAPGNGICADQGGLCTLRAAISEANALPGSDVIILPAGTYTQTLVAANDDFNAGGDFDITDSVTITGAGAATTIIQAAAEAGITTERVLHVTSPAAIVGIEGVTIRNGRLTGFTDHATRGGGIRNQGTLTLSNSVVRDNVATGAGGIRNELSLSLVDVIVTNNACFNPSRNCYGGGIYSHAKNQTLNITRGSISNNTSTSANTSFGTEAFGFAAGIGAEGGGTINISGSLNPAAPVVISNNTTIGNGSFGGGSGNALRFVPNNAEMTVYVTDAQISGNNATNGERLGAAVTLQPDIWPYSRYPVTVTMLRTTISGTTGATTHGAGISIGRQGTTGNDTLTLINSTISGNATSGYGGGIYVDNEDATLNIYNSTIAGNTANAGGGGIDHLSGGIANIRSTIVADNTGGTSPDLRGGAIVSGGYNLFETVTGASISGTTTNNIIGVDPQLAVLGNYGGPTQTKPPLPGSPAIDKGNSFGLTTDQRGRARPIDIPSIPNATGGDGADIGSFERQANDNSGAAFFDFDGDGKSDISVFRPENGVWYLQQSTNGFTGIQFGLNTDKIVPADYDGDGKTDVAVFRNGTWYLNRSQLGFTGIQFGAADDIPVPADYDGDGKSDVAVFRPSNGTWYLLQSTAGFTGIAFGQTEDKPVAADYDGDGKSDVAVFRPSNGTWYIQRSQLGFTGIAFGESTDKPVASDYDGDGKSDVAVFRPSNGVWYLLKSTAGFTGIAFGAASDLPVPADYDGDGKADVAVFRPSNGVWYLQQSTQGFTGILFGASGDKPIPNAYMR